MNPICFSAQSEPTSPMHQQQQQHHQGSGRTNATALSDYAALYTPPSPMHGYVPTTEPMMLHAPGTMVNVVLPSNAYPLSAESSTTMHPSPPSPHGHVQPPMPIDYAAQPLFEAPPLPPPSVCAHPFQQQCPNHQLPQPQYTPLPTAANTPEQPSRNLLLVNLPYEYSHAMLRNLCAGFGSVVSVNLSVDDSGNANGKGFVAFEHLEDAAMAKQSLHQRPIEHSGKTSELRVYWAKKACNRPLSGLYIRNLPGELTEEDVAHIFQIAGTRPMVSQMRPQRRNPPQQQQQTNSRNTPPSSTRHSSAQGSPSGTAPVRDIQEARLAYPFEISHQQREAFADVHQFVVPASSTGVAELRHIRLVIKYDAHATPPSQSVAMISPGASLTSPPSASVTSLHAGASTTSFPGASVTSIPNNGYSTLVPCPVVPPPSNC